MRLAATLLAGGSAAALAAQALAQTDPLPSWNDGETKAAILAFVEATTDPDSTGFVEREDRIATFDNDGTLWSEQPLYFQFFYVLDRAKQLAAADPAWASTPVLKAAAAGDVAAIVAGGKPGLAEHPEKHRLFVDMVYQPMIELLEHLRANGYETFIVSGGGTEFIRAFAEEKYGIPPPQVVGSEGELEFTMVDGEPQVMRDPGVAFVDDGPGEPVGIARHIGQRPVFVAGNSDGDLEMLQWGTAGKVARMGIIVHHTDAEREWAYDRDSDIGRLDKALDQAPAEGWIVINMANDWGTIWPTE